MKKDNSILFDRIKKTVQSVEPSADIILYGSYARGEQKEECDIDLLILVSKHSLLSYDEIKKITYPLYKIEIEIGTTISPLVYNKEIWENKHIISPFYKNVKADGILL